jgi:hypothetical protein
MTDVQDEPKSYEQHLAEIKQLVASGACDWALEKDENSGELLKPTDFTFSADFLEKHFEAIK